MHFGLVFKKPIIRNTTKMSSQTVYRLFNKRLKKKKLTSCDHHKTYVN